MAKIWGKYEFALITEPYIHVLQLQEVPHQSEKLVHRSLKRGVWPNPGWPLWMGLQLSSHRTVTTTVNWQAKMKKLGTNIWLDENPKIKYLVGWKNCDEWSNTYMKKLTGYCIDRMKGYLKFLGFTIPWNCTKLWHNWIYLLIKSSIKLKIIQHQVRGNISIFVRSHFK